MVSTVGGGDVSAYAGTKDITFMPSIVAEAGRQVREDTLVICHGGPFDESENVGEALAKMPGIAGFFGASSIEWLPTERAITGQVEAFKGLKLA
jgi:predicted TIM-barrel enzyme